MKNGEILEELQEFFSEELHHWEEGQISKASRIAQHLRASFVSRFGGNQIYIPKTDPAFDSKVNRNRCVVQDHIEGFPVRRLAHKYHLSESQIYRILKHEEKQI